MALIQNWFMISIITDTEYIDPSISNTRWISMLTVVDSAEFISQSIIPMAVHKALQLSYNCQYIHYIAEALRGNTSHFPMDQWCGALMFSLTCVCINSWLNNREAGDLRRYRAHYDGTVMHFADMWPLSYISIRVMISWQHNILKLIEMYERRI